jgi:hypothetical protein
MFKKTLIAVGIALMSLTAQPVAAFNGMDVVRVFAGLMDGIIHKDNLDYLMGCMTGTDSMVADIENAVTHFKQGGTIGIGEGIMDIGKFLQDLPPACYNCGGIPDDFAKLGQFFSIFGNPSLLSQRLAYNLLWYYSQINADVQTAIKDWDSGDYFNFGEEIGEALVLALGDHSSTNSTQPVATPQFLLY